MVAGHAAPPAAPKVNPYAVSGIDVTLCTVPTERREVGRHPELE